MPRRTRIRYCCQEIIETHTNSSGIASTAMSYNFPSNAFSSSPASNIAFDDEPQIQRPLKSPDPRRQTHETLQPSKPPKCISNPPPSSSFHSPSSSPPHPQTPSPTTPPLTPTHPPQPAPILTSLPKPARTQHVSTHIPTKQQSQPATPSSPAAIQSSAPRWTKSSASAQTKVQNRNDLLVVRDLR